MQGVEFSSSISPRASGPPAQDVARVALIAVRYLLEQYTQQTEQTKSEVERST